MPPKKDDAPKVNPLYAVGGKPKPMSQEEIISAFAPDEEPVEEPKQIIQAVPPTIQPVVQQVPQALRDLPSGPPVRRKKHKGLKFSDIYVTRSLSIDKRIVEAFDDFMESGDTKTQIANQIVLKILLDAGYNIDPDILSKPVIRSEPS